MKVSVSTEGRVFVAQLMRDIRARERAGAELLVPGSTTWAEALAAFIDSLAKSASPTKAGRKFRTGVAQLLLAQQQTGSCKINSWMGRSRSGYFELLTWHVAKHPLTQEGYEGIVVNHDFIDLRRNGMLLHGSAGPLAFLSWHALARMRERCPIDIFDAGGLVGLCGVVGYLMRESEQHLNTEINLCFDHILCLGVLRNVPRDGNNSRRFGFYDVVTAFSPDPDTQAPQIAQGTEINQTVWAYLGAEHADPRGYADKIPVLPFRKTDFVSLQLKKVAS